MKSKKVLALVLCIFMALTVLTACGGGEPNTVEGDTIKIGVFQPETGDNGAGGKLERLGTEYANKENPTVTIDGKEYKIELVMVDNESDKTKAASAAQNLLSENCVAVIGSYGSGVSIAAGSIFQKAQVPAVGTSCSNPQVTVGNDFYFRVCLIDSVQGPTGVDYALQSGYKKAALISENGDDYSTGLVNFFKNDFIEKGGEIVSEQVYQKDDSDFKAILTSIKESKPDVIYTPSSLAKMTLIIQQAHALGIDTPIMGTDTWDVPTLIKNLGKDSEGIAFSALACLDESGDYAVASKFVTNMKKFLNDNPDKKKDNDNLDIIGSGNALGYDAYMAIYNALKSLDGKGLEKITSVDVRDALVDVNFDGVTGKIVFDENGDVKAQPFVIKIENGKRIKQVIK